MQASEIKYSIQSVEAWPSEEDGWMIDSWNIKEPITLWEGMEGLELINLLIQQGYLKAGVAEYVYLNRLHDSKGTIRIHDKETHEPLFELSTNEF